METGDQTLARLRQSLRPARDRRGSTKRLGIGPKGFLNMVGTEFENIGTDPSIAIFQVIKNSCTKLVTAKAGETYECSLYSQNCYILCSTELKEGTAARDSLSSGSPYMWFVYLWKGRQATLKEKGSTGTKGRLLKNLLVANGGFHDCEIKELRAGSDEARLKELFPGVTLVDGKAPVAGEEDIKGEGVVSKSVKLYEVTLDRIRRVPVNKDSISDTRSYILDIGSAVYAYSGKECRSVVQKRYTEEMARRRCKVDYQGLFQPVNATERKSDEAEFFDKISEAGDEADGSIAEHAPKLYEYDAEAQELVRVEEETEEAGTLFDSALLESHKVFVLDCFTEVFIWVGRGSKHAQVNEAKKLVKSQFEEEARPSFFEIQSIRDRMEPVYFKEHFFGFSDMENMEIGGYYDPAAQRKSMRRERRVSQEVSRVFQFLRQEAVEDVEAKLMEDETARLVAFRITDDADLEKVADSALGVFDTSQMYIYILTVKNNAKHTIFTWEGNEASIRARTIAGILTSSGIENETLSNELTGAKSYVYVLEGKEPKELVYILKKLQRPPIIKRGKLGRGYGRSKRRAAEQLGYLNENGNLVFAYEVSSHILNVARVAEVPLATLRENRVHPALSYAFIEIKKDGSGVLLYHYNGQSTSDLNRELLDHIVAEKAAMFVSQPVTEVIQIEDEGLDTLGLQVDTHALLKVPTRPVRLYTVAIEIKKVGGLFFADVGQSLFRQRDLEKGTAFLLDTGCDKVFLWLDSPRPKDELEFCVDCAVRYVHHGLPEELGVLVDGDTLEVIDKGHEPVEFRSCFNGWANFEPSKERDSLTINSIVNEKLQLASMSSAERKSLRLSKEKSQRVVRKKSAAQAMLAGKAKDTLRRGMFAKYTKGKTLGVAEKLGDRVTLGRQNSLHIGDLAVPLKISQAEVTVDDVVKEMRESEKTDWCLYQYVSRKQLKYVGHGEGGVDSLLEAIDESKLQYALVKLCHASVDRVIFITFRPETLSPMLKNMVSVHRSVVQEILGPVFASISVAEKSELNAERLDSVISRAQH